MSVNVSKIFAARPRWHYNPTMWLYKRMVEVALLETSEQRPDGSPTDEALLARDWIATSEMESEYGQECQYISFPKVCDVLGVNADANRVGLLEIIDRGADFDTDQAWDRLEALKSAQLSDDEEAFQLPAWARIVPAVDQGSLWLAGEKPRRPRVHRLHLAVAATSQVDSQQLALGMA